MEARSLKSKCWQSYTPSGGSRGEFLAFLSFLGLGRISISMSYSSSISVLFCLSFIMHIVFRFTWIIQNDLILRSLITSEKHPFSVSGNIHKFQKFDMSFFRRGIFQLPQQIIFIIWLLQQKFMNPCIKASFFFLLATWMVSFMKVLFKS